jgi:hypothetical protein
MVVSGHNVYVTNRDGCSIIDVTNPASPYVVVRDGPPIFGAVHGSFAYHDDNDGFVMVNDISDLGSPNIVNRVYVSPHIDDVQRCGSTQYAYCGTDEDAVYRIRLQCAPEPPVVSAGGPYEGECHLPVVFDAQGSQAHQGQIVLYEWDWDGDGIYDERTTAPVVRHSYDSVYEGMIGLRVTDDNQPSLSAECEAAVVIKDTRVASILDVTLAPDAEWLPDPPMVAVSLNVESWDHCDSSPVSRIVSVTNAETTGAKTQSHSECEVAGDLSLKLPLDDSSSPKGSLYVVTIVCGDDAGNETAAKATIRAAFERGRPKVTLESITLDLEPPGRREDDGGRSVKVKSAAAEGGTGITAEGGTGMPVEGRFHALGLVGKQPNPMGSHGKVQFSLPSAASVHLAVYDVRGRLVRALARRTYSPGLHSIAWEPRSDDGTPLSQGIYFVRLDVEGKRFTRRFVVIH